MLQAQGYTPSMVYVEAGENIARHQAVSIFPDGIVKPSSPSTGVAIGFALADAEKGSKLTVQVGGVLYGYSYNNTTLSPGVWYYQGGRGTITDHKDGSGHVIGYAVAEDILRIFIIGSGTEEEKKTIADYIDGGHITIIDPEADEDIVDRVDGSGTLTDSIEHGWNDWGSISSGLLDEMYSSGRIESGLDKLGMTEDGLGIADGGNLSDLFDDDNPSAGDGFSEGGGGSTPSLWDLLSGQEIADGGSLSDLTGNDNDNTDDNNTDDTTHGD